MNTDARARLSDSTAIDAIGANGPIYIDGPFAKNSVYLAEIAHRQVHDANGSGVVSGIERLLSLQGC